MGKHGAHSVWAICRACRRNELTPDMVTRGWTFRCVCGSTDYSLTINDPTQPVRPAMQDSGPSGADIRLPDEPVDVDAAREAGRYP